MNFPKTPETPIKRLDATLTILQQQKSYKLFDEIESILIDASILIPQDDLVRILDKLIKDELIIEAKTDRRQNLIEKRYLISYTGLLFNGYENQEKINKINQTIAVQNEKRIMRNEIWLLRGTWAAAIIGFLVLAWYVFQWYFPHYSDYPYHWIWETIPKRMK